jgi:hypothetical protein
LLLGRHASVLPGKQELKQLCVCYPQVLAAILMGSPNRSIRKPRPRPTTPGQRQVQLPDHRQDEFWMPRRSSDAYECAGVPARRTSPVLSPPSLWRGLAHGTPRLIDVYPRFGAALMFQCLVAPAPSPARFPEATKVGVKQSTCIARTTLEGHRGRPAPMEAPPTRRPRAPCVPCITARGL